MKEADGNTVQALHVTLSYTGARYTTSVDRRRLYTSQQDTIIPHGTVAMKMPHQFIKKSITILWGSF